MPKHAIEKGKQKTLFTTCKKSIRKMRDKPPKHDTRSFSVKDHLLIYR